MLFFENYRRDTPRHGSQEEGAPENDSEQKAETTASFTPQSTLTW